MARKQEPIKVVSYVRVGGELVNTEDLSPERKRELATWLTCTYMNHLFAGKATFHPASSAPECPAGAERIYLHRGKKDEQNENAAPQGA